MKDLAMAHGVQTRVALPTSMASAAILFLFLGSLSVQAEDSGWKPSWQLPPTSSGQRVAENNSPVVKAAWPAGTAGRSPARTQAATDSAQPAARRRSYPVRTASAQLETTREPAVQPIPQPESVPQGQVMQNGTTGPFPAEIVGPPDENGYVYPGYGGPACGPCDDGCSFRLPFEPCWFQPLNGIVYTRAEYLMWWGKGSDSPALVSDGALPDGNVLFGGDSLNDGFRSGFRVALGLWMDPCQTSAVEAIYTGLGRDVQTYNASGGPNDSLVRPYFDTTDGQTVSIIAGSNAGVDYTGSIRIRSDSDFQAFDLLYRQAIARQCGFRIDGLVGYRFAHLDEGLSIFEQETTNVGAAQTATDSFRTLNEFHGGEIGANLQWQWNRWSFGLLSKLAMGYTRMGVTIAGESNYNGTDYNGGLLALSSQVGQYSDTQFSVNPELGLTLGYDLTCRLRATFGYSLSYWSKVARPGDQISTTLNTHWFPNDPTPATPPSFPGIVTTDYWAQGMNFGLEYRF